eukprot:20162-Heterococcus_DN1.PRE.2
MLPVALPVHIARDLMLCGDGCAARYTMLRPILSTYNETAPPSAQAIVKHYARSADVRMTWSCAYVAVSIGITRAQVVACRSTCAVKRSSC